MTAVREVVVGVPKVRLLGLVAALLAVAGCSAQAPAPPPAPSSTASSPTPDPSPSAASCPSGSYVVAGLEGRGDASAIGRGTGGNIHADFTGGTFTLSSDGTDPVSLDLGATKAQLRLNGAITSTYTGDASALRLTLTGAQGDVTVRGFGVSRTYSTTSLADQLVGSGATAQVTCDDAAGTATVVLPNASLTLTRR